MQIKMKQKSWFITYRVDHGDTCHYESDISLTHPLRHIHDMNFRGATKKITYAIVFYTRITRKELDLYYEYSRYYRTLNNKHECK